MHDSEPCGHEEVEIHAYMYMHACMYAYTYKHACMRVCVCVCMYVCTYVRTYVYVVTYTCSSYIAIATYPLALLGNKIEK